jgi:DNA-binding transcriptional LysR family regulator
MSSTPAEMVQGLAEGLFDAAVVESCEQFDLSAFLVHPLPEAEVLFVAAPSVGVPDTIPAIDALLDLPLFTRREGCCSRTLLERGLKAIGRDIRDFRKLIVLDDLHVLVQAVLAGDGVSFLSSDLLSTDLAAGRIRAYRVPGFQHGRKRALVVGQPHDPAGPLAGLVAAVLAHFDPPRPARTPMPSDPCLTCLDGSSLGPTSAKPVGKIGAYRRRTSAR